MSTPASTIDTKHWQTKYSYKNAQRANIRRSAQIIIPPIMAVTISTIYLIIYGELYQGQSSENWLIEIGLSLLGIFPAAISLYVTFILFKSVRTFFEAIYQPKMDTNSTLLILRRLFGFTPFILIQKEKLDPPNEWIKWFGGPAKLITFDGFALYLERGNRFSRVVGPGTPVPFLDRTETVKAIVDLRPQVRQGEYSKVRAWTKDGICIEMDVRMECRIGSDKMMEASSEQLLYPYDPIAVKKAVDHTAVLYNHEKKCLVETSWVDGVWGKVQGFLAAYISSHSIDELFLAEWGSSQILSQNVSKDLLEKINASIKDYGAYLINLQIININIPEDVNRQRLNTWEAERQSIASITEGQAKAYGIRTREKARAEAQRDIIAAIAEELKKMDPARLQESLLLSLSDILDQCLSDSMTRAYITSETLNTLEKLNNLLK